MANADKYLQLLKIVVMRDGIRIPDDPEPELVWLVENGYLEPFEDANGTACYRASKDAVRIVDQGSFNAKAG